VILIPVKNLSAAKQRLAALLDQPSRTRLAQAMLQDVLTAVHGWKDRPQVALVTSDPYAVELAREYRFEIIPDPDNLGETAAIEMATQAAIERRAQSTLVIPADIPLIQAWELEELIKHAPAEGSVLVPAGDGRGTNAAFRRQRIYFRCVSAMTASSRITQPRRPRASRASYSSCQGSPLMWIIPLTSNSCYPFPAKPAPSAWRGSMQKVEGQSPSRGPRGATDCYSRKAAPPGNPGSAR